MDSAGPAFEILLTRRADCKVRDRGFRGTTGGTLLRDFPSKEALESGIASNLLGRGGGRGGFLSTRGFGSFLIKTELWTQSGSASAENGLDLRLGFGTNSFPGGWTVAFTGAPSIWLMKNYSFSASLTRVTHHYPATTCSVRSLVEAIQVRRRHALYYPHRLHPKGALDQKKPHAVSRRKAHASDYS